MQKTEKNMESPHQPSYQKTKRSILSILLLKPTLQFRYISVVFIAILFVCIAMGFHFHFAVIKKITVELGYAELKHVLVQMNIIMVSLFLSYAFIVLVFSILISHKFAGPIYRFEKILQQISGGDLTHRIDLRKGDELLELKDHINCMISNLNKKIQTDREHIQAILQKIDSISKDFPHDPNIQNQLHTIKKEINSLTQSFKI